MNILFYSSVFPHPGEPTRGTFCANLCKRLASHHNLHVISAWEWHRRIRTSTRAIRDFLRGPDMRILNVECPCFLYPPRILWTHHDTFMWHSCRRAFRRSLESFKPDCVLSYWAYPDGAAALRAARSLGVPLGLIIGGTDVLLIDNHPARARFLEVLHESDLLLPVSRHLGDHLVRLGVDRAKIRVVYQGVDKTLFHVGDRDEARNRIGLDRCGNMLLWVGRMVEVKGLDVLLKACASLRGRNRDFRLYLIGDGPLRIALQKQAIELGLAQVVVFVGPKRPAELPDWYRSSDMLVLSSHSEGIPNVLREALACGRPFVASNVGGIPELIDPACRLVPPNSVPELADAIEDVISNHHDPVAISLRAPNPTWDESARQVSDLLQQCIASFTGPGGVPHKPDWKATTLTGSTQA